MSQIKKRIGDLIKSGNTGMKEKEKEICIKESQKGGLSTMILFCWI